MGHWELGLHPLYKNNVEKLKENTRQPKNNKIKVMCTEIGERESNELQ